MYVGAMMELKEFNQRIKLAKIKGDQVDALKSVLVRGRTAYSVSKETGVAASQLSRAIKKLNRPLCKCCGQFVIKKDSIKK